MAFFGGAPFSFTARFVSGVLALLLQMSEFSFASLASLLARGVAGASPGDCSAQDSVGAGGTSSFTADPLTSTGDFWGHRSAPAGSGARGSGEQGREPFLTSLSGVLFSFRGSCNFFMSSRSAVTHSSRRLL
uniref:Putative secreted protein n=1 Tax=Ixodes ricinus TaxID=34613 RepID=A0A6B0US06_IXORI